MELPGELLTHVFRLCGLQHADGTTDKLNFMLVCRMWRQQLEYAEFWHAGCVPVDSFENRRQLRKFLERFRARHAQLTELEWRGHLKSDEFAKEEGFLQLLLPPPSAPWGGLRVLRMTDCSVGMSSQCQANMTTAIARACPNLEELRFRGASPSYSLHRVSRRAELLSAVDLLALLQGCKKLRILDVACTGSSPFAPRFGKFGNVLEAISTQATLESITLFGEQLPWDQLGVLAECRTLREIVCFGDASMRQLPFSLPVLSSSVTCLRLQEYSLGGKPPVTLANSLPGLQEIHIQILPPLGHLGGLCDFSKVPVNIRNFTETLYESNKYDLQQLRSYFENPWPKPIRMTLSEINAETPFARDKKQHVQMF